MRIILTPIARHFVTDGFARATWAGSTARGYLFLAGRIKEIINRGGEKISPREVDEVLLDHPAVATAVTFGVPDARLGEEIAAAIVLRPGAAANQQQIMEFAAARLAEFKVPRRVVFLDEIPKGPTGKVQRIGLARQLGIESPAPAPLPTARTLRSPFDPRMRRRWRLSGAKCSTFPRFAPMIIFCFWAAIRCLRQK